MQQKIFQAVQKCWRECAQRSHMVHHTRNTEAATTEDSSLTHDDPPSAANGGVIFLYDQAIPNDVASANMRREMVEEAARLWKEQGRDRTQDILLEVYCHHAASGDDKAKRCDQSIPGRNGITREKPLLPRSSLN